MKTKTLTFKAPNKMKTILVVFALAFIFSHQVKDVTANTLYTVADIIYSNR
jgi:hypothetical protein